MDSEVTGSKGKRRRLWVAGGVGAVLVVGVLAGLAANGSRSGSASDIISFTCSGQTFWFNNAEEKRYGDIENKADKLVNAEFLKSKCNLGEVHSDTGNFAEFLYRYTPAPSFWVFDDAGKRCEFTYVSYPKEPSFKLLSCFTGSKTDELYVLRKD
jgi:hypothetical protein